MTDQELIKRTGRLMAAAGERSEDARLQRVALSFACPVCGDRAPTWGEYVAHSVSYHGIEPAPFRWATGLLVDSS